MWSYAEFKKMFKDFKRNPKNGFIIIILVASLMGIVGWIKGFSGKKGEQFATFKEEQVQENKGQSSSNDPRGILDNGKYSYIADNHLDGKSIFLNGERAVVVNNDLH